MAAAFGRSGRGTGTLPTARKFCFVFVFSCCYARVDRLIVSTCPHAVRESVYKKAPESKQTTKNAKLKLLVKSPAQKIADLEVVCVDLKHEKENVIAGYQRLAEKHKTFTEKAEREKMELAKTHGELDEETRGYTNYCLNMRHRFHELHETMALSFDEVKAQCLPFPARGVKVEEMID
jgi:hypothetical protein